MTKYLEYSRTTIKDFSPSNIESMYARGFLFGRIEHGFMTQTRSLRINLSMFDLSSENRRILRKNESLDMRIIELPIPSDGYNWQIHRMGKEFYLKKFGEKLFSASKIKKLITEKHNFTTLFTYSDVKRNASGESIGYCISFVSPHIVHYAYPFYDLTIDTGDLGMGMMLKAILHAKEAGKKYIYLGSYQRESDRYKMQFKGEEIWDDEKGEWVKV